MKKSARSQWQENMEQALMPRKSRRSNSEMLINEYDDGKSLYPQDAPSTIPAATNTRDAPRNDVVDAPTGQQTYPNDNNNKPLPSPSSQTKAVIAPERDFNKRANSLERRALPSGLFPGSSKKLYDALYLRTRGAIQPSLTVKATNRNLMEWTGIRNVKTIRLQIRNLSDSGLVTRYECNGDRQGDVYKVRLPEETAGETASVTPTSTSTSTSTNFDPYQYQKLVWDPYQKLVGDGRGLLYENKGTYDFPKTSYKTNTNDDDDSRSALAILTQVLAQAARDLTGSAPTVAEAERWGEVGRIIVTELKVATGRTGPISSVPAFLAAHLKRRFAKPVALPHAEKNAAPFAADSSGSMPDVTRRLSAEEIAEYVGFIFELLENGYTEVQAVEQFAQCFNADDWATIFDGAKRRCQASVNPPTS